MEKEFVYALRITICPDFYSDEKFEQLLEFCKEAKINDIMFIFNPEEINLGHPTLEETKTWLDMLKRFRPDLEKEGITISLNPWTTLLHTDRGRTLRKNQKFGLMEDYEGNRAEAVACPIDKEFKEYISETYRLFGEFGFYAVWVEDDFRLHNHAPLVWGGCFCKNHLKEFSKRAGINVKREEMFEGMTRPGIPHPYRKIWLDTARDTMIELAKVLGEAVHKVSPKTRVGLMSSAPEVHCIEGRDWETVFGNLAGDTRPLDRPHLPAYWESVPRRYALEFQRYSRLTAAMTKGKAELWPELDNLPHTSFSKSHRFALLEMESTLSLCVEGITINIYDMIGNGINKAQKNEEMLVEIKPYLTAVKQLAMKGKQEQGVYVLYSPYSSYTLHTDGKKMMESLQPWETFWAEYLSAYGIACRYSDDYTIKGKIVAVSGQYFRNLSKQEIERLFKDNILVLEGEAVETLLDMGLGYLAGVEEREWYSLNGGLHSYEQVADNRCYQGLPEARITAQGISEAVETGDYLHIKYKDNIKKEVFSVMKKADGTTVGDGLVRYGNVIIFPYGHIRDQYNFLLSPIRQEMLQRALSEVPMEQPSMVLGCQYVTINDFCQEERRILLLTNYSTDDFEKMSIVIKDKPNAVYEIDKRTGEKKPLEFYIEEGRLILSGKLEHMKSRCVILE